MKRLRQLREASGLSPEQLAVEIGEISGMTIRRLEAGTRPQAQTAKKIADHFELKPWDIWPEDRAAA